jgi:ABC-type dipeptide/oligopeptide/nickel transport system ATPase component
MLGEYPHRLSGGMRQRVLIAMALACKPSVLIADEPTTALDVTTQAQVLDLIVRLQAELGFGVLLITHDLAVVAETCARTVVMRAGRLVEEGATATLIAQPREVYTQTLLANTLRVRRPAGAAP